jgi:hypothetical protein
MSISVAKATDEIVNKYKNLLRETAKQISISLGYGYKSI